VSSRWTGERNTTTLNDRETEARKVLVSGTGEQGKRPCEGVGWGLSGRLCRGGVKEGYRANDWSCRRH